MVKIQFLGKIDIQILEKEYGKILTDEIIVTNERISHIKERHPEDYSLFEKYGCESVTSPDLIIKDIKHCGTVFMIKKLPQTNLNLSKRTAYFTKKNKCDIVYIKYKGFTQRIIEVEIVLLRTLWVKRNVGKGTPTDNSLV